MSIVVQVSEKTAMQNSMPKKKEKHQTPQIRADRLEVQSIDCKKYMPNQMEACKYKWFAYITIKPLSHNTKLQ